MGGVARRELAFALAAFAASLLPRLGPLLAGTCFADDFVHVPYGHLESYRFLNWAELGLWQFVFGPDYLLTTAPKWIGALYSTALAVLLRRFLLPFGEMTAIALPLVVVAHPIWNVFIAWNVATVYVLSLVCIVGGYLLLMGGRRVAGVGVIALGISGYQVHAALLAPLLFLDWWSGAAAASAAESESRRPKRPPLHYCLAAGALYLLATFVAKLGGLETWGARGLGLTHFREQLHAASDNLATLTQPLLSYYLGIEAAWRAWTWPFLASAILTAIFVKQRRVLATLATLALPALVALIILPLNVVPTGPRMAAAIWIATLLAAVPLFERARYAWIVLALLALPVTLADNANRVTAWKSDLAVLARVRGAVTIRHREAPPLAGRPIVMQNFQPVTAREYANVCHEKQSWFFEHYGIDVTANGTPVECPTF